MPKPLPHHWRKLTSHKLSSANDIGQASTIPRNSYVVTVKKVISFSFVKNHRAIWFTFAIIYFYIGCYHSKLSFEDLYSKIIIRLNMNYLTRISI